MLVAMSAGRATQLAKMLAWSPLLSLRVEYGRWDSSQLVSPTTAVVVPRHGVWCVGVTVTTVPSQTTNVPSLGQPRPDSAPGLVSQPLLGEPLLGDHAQRVVVEATAVVL